MEKTHILKNPNKNYLGSWDIPQSGNLVLTIKKMVWEDVKNPSTGKTESSRVVHFYENVKPMLCNQINGKGIIKATGIKFMEDLGKARIVLHEADYYNKFIDEDIKVLRVRHSIAPKEELKKDSIAWDGVLNALKGKYTIEQVKSKYSISEKNETLLNKLANEK